MPGFSSGFGGRTPSARDPRRGKSQAPAAGPGIVRDGQGRYTVAIAPGQALRLDTLGRLVLEVGDGVQVVPGSPYHLEAKIDGDSVQKDTNGRLIARPRVTDIQGDRGSGGTLRHMLDELYAYIRTILGSILSDGDKGDIVLSSSGTVWTIDANAVGPTKLADANESVLLGRGQGAGAGDPEEITLGTNLTMTGTTLSAIPGIIDTRTSDPVSPSTGQIWLRTDL